MGFCSKVLKAMKISPGGRISSEPLVINFNPVMSLCE
jgi:hypothetical protein